MFRFFKLFREHYLGFWIFGLVLFAVQEIPYMIMPLIKPDPNPIMNMKESSAGLDITEKILGSVCIALMVFVVNDRTQLFFPADKSTWLFFGSAAAVLILNFIGWGIYYSGTRTMFVMMFFIVLMPPLFYVFIGLWRQNIPLTVTGVVFTAVHFIHVYGNLHR